MFSSVSFRHDCFPIQDELSLHRLTRNNSFPQQERTKKSSFLLRLCALSQTNFHFSFVVHDELSQDLQSEMRFGNRYQDMRFSNHILGTVKEWDNYWRGPATGDIIAKSVVHYSTGWSAVIKGMFNSFSYT